MKKLVFPIFFVTAIMGLSAGADAATHVFRAKKLSLDPSTDTVNAGYYSSATLSAVDTDLAPGNIKGGVTIFGKLGTYTTGYALPDTGQTVHFSTAIGDDSDYQPAAAQQSYAVYNIVGVSSVTFDNRTGLIWVTNPVDAVISSSYTWENAIIACENLSYAGYNDWRLPNARELMSIVDCGKDGPAINTEYFLNTQNSAYWTSTTNAASAGAGWVVYFNHGWLQLYTKNNIVYIRCVRGGL